MVAYTDNRVLSAPSLAGRTDHPLRNSELQGDEHGNTAGNEIQQEQDYLIPVSVQFCPTRAQSHILASAGEAGVVEFYDTSDRNKIKECPEKQVWCHQDAIFAVEWSKTGNRLATAGGDHTSAVVDAAKSTVMCYLRGHKGSLRSLKWSDINQGKELNLDLGHFLSLYSYSGKLLYLQIIFWSRRPEMATFTCTIFAARAQVTLGPHSVLYLHTVTCLLKLLKDPVVLVA